MGSAVSLAERAHLDTGRPHVADEEGEAPMLGHVRIRPGEQDGPVRLARPAGPHLLPVDDPFLAVAQRRGCQAGQVRSGTRPAAACGVLPFVPPWRLSRPPTTGRSESAVSREAPTMKVVIDGERCSGHGRCYSLAPEVFEADDEG